jgi:hexosaminidase
MKFKPAHLFRLILVLVGSSVLLRATDLSPTQRLMPAPAHLMTTGAGQLTISSNFVISSRGCEGDTRVERAVERFRVNLGRRAGLKFESSAIGPPDMEIMCREAGEKVQKLGEDESYRLWVSEHAIRLEAGNPLGVIHGLQTLLQLAQPGSDGAVVPIISIVDSPRFPWRGLLMDVSRHFMPVEVIKRNLDGMEAVKLNVLHWHLADDQAFRVESKKFPKFAEKASGGQFYTHQQIKDVIAYARDRGIRVVPEFDMPGHTTAWFAAYPELASLPGPYEPWKNFGVNDPAIDPTRDHTYHFLDDLIGEMSRLFPDSYFHIGGDEVNGKQWNASPRIRVFKRRHKMRRNADLQAYFNQKLLKIVTRHGKIMEGWDEILHADLPKDVLVQSWRGQKSLADAAHRGYRGLLSFGYYLDLMQPAQQSYLMDPLGGAAMNLSPDEQKRVLGGEACMWAELVTPENVDSRIWPRTAAIAERFWSPQDVRDVDSMYARLPYISEELGQLGLTHNTSHRRMLERLRGSSDIESLRVLADVVEPVKGYQRPHTRHYETDTPLNRFVDAVRPESDQGRIFAAQVARYLAKTASPEDLAAMRKMFHVWQANDTELAAVIQSNTLLQEIAPLSSNLALAATAGLQAMDSLDAGKHVPSAWRQQQLDMLREAQKPQAELLNMMAGSAQKLVEAIVVE